MAIELTTVPTETGLDLAADLAFINDVSETPDALNKVELWRLSQVKGADIASAATLNLGASTGDLVDVTGVNAITAITLAEGRKMTVRFTGALILTHSATLVLPNNGANIVTIAGDTAIFRGYAAGVVRCILYQKQAGSGGAASPLTLTANNAAEIPLTLKLAAAPTGNPLEVNSSAGSAGDIFKVNSTGHVVTPKVIARTGENISIQAGAAANEVRLLDPDGNIPLAIFTKQVNLWGMTLVTQTPAQITADQNNYSVNINLGQYLRMSSDLSRNVTGLVIAAIGNKDGALLQIVNVGANNIVLVHESASSTAGNRFLCSTGASITLSANQAADVEYDLTSARWRVYKRS